LGNYSNMVRDRSAALLADDDHYTTISATDENNAAVSGIKAIVDWSRTGNEFTKEEEDGGDELVIVEVSAVDYTPTLKWQFNLDSGANFAVIGWAGRDDNIHSLKCKRTNVTNRRKGPTRR
jgi:hypothetical protein